MKTSSDFIEHFGNPTLDNVSFERRWMTLWDVPQDIKQAIPALPKKLYCNRLLVEPLERTFRALIAAGLHREIRTWDGCFNIRKKRGLATLSVHAFGLAIDLNAALNPLMGRVTWSSEFLAVWRSQGWICGADWPIRIDGMHFQWEKF